MGPWLGIPVRKSLARSWTVRRLMAVFAVLLAAGCFRAGLAPEARAQNQAEAIVSAAQAMEGAGYPYCFDGGNTSGPTLGTTDPYPDPGYYTNCSQIGKVGFDCTGLTLYAVYRGTGNAGLSHDGYQAKSGGGQVIGSKASLREGDVVYFDRNTANGLNYIDHAGIYVGNEEVLSAASEKSGILTEPFSWYEHGGLYFVGGVRYWSGGESGGANPNNPDGSYDAASSPEAGAIRIGGWAFDPNAETSPVTIHAYVGAPAGSSGAEGHDLGPAAGHRPDVGRTYPGVGDYHGFDFTFATDKVGSVPVCVYAINIGAGGNTALGCKTVTVANPNPDGSYDAASSPEAGAVRVGGWAFDPNAETSPVTIHAYVGGPAGSSGAEGHDLGPAAGHRPDVGRTYPGVGDYHGFDFTFATDKVGSVPVCVYAINVGLGHNQPLGCRTISVEARPPQRSSPPPPESTPIAGSPAETRKPAAGAPTPEEGPGPEQQASGSPAPEGSPAKKAPSGTLRVAPLGVVVHGRARIRVSCGGSTTCHGVARLIVRTGTTRKAPGRHSGRRTKTIGKVRYDIGSGGHRRISMHLDSLGKRKMRRAGAAGLKATLVGRHLKNRQVRLRFSSAVAAQLRSILQQQRRPPGPAVRGGHQGPACLVSGRPTLHSRHLRTSTAPRR